MMAGSHSTPAAALAGPGTASGRPATCFTTPSQGPASRAVMVPTAKAVVAVPNALADQFADLRLASRSTGAPATDGPRAARKADVGVLETLSQPEAYVIADIQGFCSPRSNVDSQLRAYVEEFVRCQESACGSLSYRRERSNALLARELTSKGYTVAIRHHSASNHPAIHTSTSSCPSVRDTYIVFSGVPGSASDEYVIELDFRDRFNIANSTAFYNTCLSVVPEVWVGPMDQLLPLVELLCAEMSMAFNECDLDMPPWRCYDKVVSRWISNELKSFSVDSGATMAESPEVLTAGLGHSHGSRNSPLGSLDDVLGEAGLTLTPLQLHPRTCSLNFDKIEPVSPVEAAAGLRKTTSLLGIHLMSNPSPVSSPKKLGQTGRRLTGEGNSSRVWGQS